MTVKLKQTLKRNEKIVTPMHKKSTLHIQWGYIYSVIHFHKQI